MTAPRPFADLVFHVLAHVPGVAPASVWDPEYVAWSEARLGPASGRMLGDDAKVLAASLSSHDDLARAQMLAWLFRERGRARACFERSLAELSASDVDEAALLSLLANHPAAEVLWCSVALEDEAHAKLPPIDIAGVTEAVSAMSDVAPLIETFEIGVVRALRLRGRVRGKEIFIGSPEVTSLERIAWQAAHEATVAELAPKNLPFDALEREAIALLKQRAARAGKTESHARWLATIRVPSPRL